MADNLDGSFELPPQTSTEFGGLTLKVAPRCNLACDYCYEYLEDNTAWRRQPRGMPLDVVRQAARRLDDYVTRHGLSRVQVSFHGGEPLLLGAEGIDERATILRDTVSCNLDLAIQTNGTLLEGRADSADESDEDKKSIMDVLIEHDFQVGVSLDGNLEANDRFRLDHAGRSSHDKVLRGIDLLKRTNLQWGLLAVIDIRNDPLETYNALKRHDPPLGLDFLLPHGNWTHPPPYRDGSEATPYADWILPIWREYFKATDYTPSIRKFDAVMRMVEGGTTLTDSLGNTAPTQLFVRPDGKYEDVDTLLSAHANAPVLDMDVFRHSFDEVAEHEWMVYRRAGSASLSKICQQCDIVSICGGGYIPHRYKEENGFDNPSVYCSDLMAIIKQVQLHVQQLG